MDFIFDPSLVLYLPLYELDGASIMNRSAYGHTCVVTGALWRPNGRYFYNTNDWINCGTASPFNITGAITLEAWIYPTVTMTNNAILAKDEANERSYCLMMSTGAKSRFHISTDGTGTTSVIHDTVTSEDNWHHIVGVYNKANVLIYQDLVLKTGGAETGDINVGTARVTLGDYYDIAGNYVFGGVIGEVRIYSRALSHLEISHNYEATKGRYR